MPDLFDLYLDKVENLEWSFALQCSLHGLDDVEMENHLGCRCPYGLYGYLEEIED
jgi:hypothetical protein